MQQRSSPGENRLLQRLAATDFSRSSRSSKKRSWSQGDVLHPAGEPIDHVYFPISGMVSMLSIMRTGQAVEIGVIGREGVAGASIVAEGSRSFAQAMVQMPGEAWRLAAAPFLKLFEASKDFRTQINGTSRSSPCRRSNPRPATPSTAWRRGWRAGCCTRRTPPTATRST